MITVEEMQDYFKMADDFNLFYRRWKAIGEVQRTVVCIHGSGLNSGCFKFLGERSSRGRK